MSVALPWVLAVGLASAVIVGVLHLLSVRRPPTLLLPTARFVPDRDVRAVSRTRTPSDLLLLALRVLALLCAAVAVAGVRCAAGKASVARVIVIDRGVSLDSVQLRRMVQATPSNDAMAFAALAPRDARTGSAASAFDDAASAALFPLAWRTTASLLRAEGRLDSVDLHVFAVRAPASDDAAWRAWRATWPGRVVLHVRDSAPAERTRVGGPLVRLRRAVGEAQTPANDVVVSGFRAAGVAAGVALRVNERDGVDSAVTVQWPVNGVPDGWRALPAADSTSLKATALVSQGRALAADWQVAAVPGDADTVGIVPIAWWSDGRVAALERRAGSTCVREVAVRVDDASDVLLTPDAAAFIARLAAPCATSSPQSPGAFTRVLSDGGASATSTGVRAVLGNAMSTSTDWWTPLLLGLAVLLVLLEWWLRSRDTAATAVSA